MPEYLSPGVYIQEKDSGPRPIEGVGTAMAAFVGFAATGPANRPVLITNWSQYVSTFGRLEEGEIRNPHFLGTYLSYAVYGYFLNGGGRCYVTRIRITPGKQEPLKIRSRSSEDQPSLIIHAKQNTGDDIQVDILPPSPSRTAKQSGLELFNLRVRMGAEEELYTNLSLAQRDTSSTTETLTQDKAAAASVKDKAVEASVQDKAVEVPLQIRTVAKETEISQLIKVVEAQTTGTSTERAPKLGSYFIRESPMTTLPQVQSNHFSGEVTDRSGFEGLAVADDVTMVCCPDLMAALEAKIINPEGVKQVQQAMISYCERMGDRIAILDPLPGLSPQAVKKWREQETNYDSKFAVLYYPWIKVAGNSGPAITIPPSGHMAGIYARNDNERGVHKAPANEVVRGASDPATQVTKGEQDTLNPIGVNCIRSFTGRGLRVWGARTLSSDPAWRYVNVRRLFNYVEKSIERGTQWVVFEPNDMDLWARVKRDITAFLTGAWREGMLFGQSPEEAFFVKCDAELNPPDVRDRGQLFIDIGLAPVKPAEFVIFRLSQWAGGGA